MVARDAAKCPTMQREPFPHATDNDLAQNVNHAGVDKSCSI